MKDGQGWQGDMPFEIDTVTETDRDGMGGQVF